MALLQVQNISKQIQQNTLLNSTNFIVNKFENLAIAGATGSGKTTLMQIIAGLQQPTTGNIFLNNKRVKGPLEQLLPGNPKIAYLSQHFELRNNYTMQELLEMTNTVDDEAAKNVYTICKIEHLLGRKNTQLSGGERQRVALAKLLLTQPTLLLLDEPFTNLDALHKSIIKQVIQTISTKLQITCIMVAHDAADILPWAHTILVMQQGNIIQTGTPKQIYYNPVNQYCAALFGSYNIVDTENFVELKQEHTNKKIFLRPEHLQIEKATNYAMQDIITNIQFFGSHYQIQVQSNNANFIIHTTKNNFSVGDRVFIYTNEKQLWYI